MIRFNRFDYYSSLGALLLCFSLNLSAAEIQEANKLYKQGQYSQALSKIDSFLIHQPKDAEARFLKGVMLTEQGQTEDGLRSKRYKYESHLQFDPARSA